MSDNPPETPTNIDVKDGENIDSDKSFESCVNSATEGINNLLAKDDDSEKSFQSCSMNINDKAVSNNEANGDNANADDNDDEDDDDDDDIRPGSCRENPSSDDDEVSSWDENNDHWIYDAEYLHESKNHKELPKAEMGLGDDSRRLCEHELESIIENHVAAAVKDKPASKKPSPHNPTFIPTNGRFYMHDLRSDAKENHEAATHKARTAKKAGTKGGGGGGKLNDSWSHDLYDEHRQQPISKLELIDKYGEDIRSRGSALRQAKENRPKRIARTSNSSKRHGYSRFQQQQSQQQQSYYDYYDNYDSYDSSYDPYYYYGNDAGYYYDYRYYGGGGGAGAGNASSWKRRSSKDGAHAYKSSTNQKGRASQKAATKAHPPSKYSEIAEFTDIKITVNLDNLGARQITSVSGAGCGSKRQPNAGGRGALEGSGTTTGSSRPINDGPAKPDRHNDQPPPQRRHPPAAKERSGDAPAHRSNNRARPVPDWMHTQLEWGGDASAVIEEMPPLTEKEINQLSSRRHQNARVAPPRFSRDKSSSATDPGKGGRAQSFVPKRYSELRVSNNNGSDSNHTTHHQPPPPPPQPSTIAPAEQQQQQLIAYAPAPQQHPQQPPMIPNIDYYGNLLQPHHHMVSLSSLLQSGFAPEQQQQHHQQQQQYYIQPLYLPGPAGGTRISQYPSFVSPGGPVAAPLYPSMHNNNNNSSHSNGNNNNNNSSNISGGNPTPLINNNSASTNAAPSSQHIRPVLGRS